MLQELKNSAALLGTSMAPPAGAFRDRANINFLSIHYIFICSVDIIFNFDTFIDAEV